MRWLCKMQQCACEGNETYLWNWTHPSNKVRNPSTISDKRHHSGQKQQHNNHDNWKRPKKCRRKKNQSQCEMIVRDATIRLWGVMEMRRTFGSGHKEIGRHDNTTEIKRNQRFPKRMQLVPHMPVDEIPSSAAACKICMTILPWLAANNLVKRAVAATLCMRSPGGRRSGVCKKKFTHHARCCCLPCPAAATSNQGDAVNPNGRRSNRSSCYSSSRSAVASGTTLAVRHWLILIVVVFLLLLLDFRSAPSIQKQTIKQMLDRKYWNNKQQKKSIRPWGLRHDLQTNKQDLRTTKNELTANQQSTKTRVWSLNQTAIRYDTYKKERNEKTIKR